MSLPDDLFHADGCGSARDIWPYLAPLFWRIVGEEANGLDIGCSSYKFLDSAIGLDTRRGDHGKPSHWPNAATGNTEGVNLVGDACDLRWFADGQLDYVFSSHALEHMPRDRAFLAVREWLRVLRPGGLLFLYLPDGRVWEYDDAHDWHPRPDDFTDLLAAGTSEWRVWVPRETLPEKELVRSIKISFVIMALK